MVVLFCNFIWSVKFQQNGSCREVTLFCYCIMWDFLLYYFDHPYHYHVSSRGRLLGENVWEIFLQVVILSLWCGHHRLLRFPLVWTVVGVLWWRDDGSVSFKQHFHPSFTEAIKGAVRFKQYEWTFTNSYFHRIDWLLFKQSKVSLIMCVPAWLSSSVYILYSSSNARLPKDPQSRE
jgi:hypothetical protein